MKEDATSNTAGRENVKKETRGTRRMRKKTKKWKWKRKNNGSVIRCSRAWSWGLNRSSESLVCSTVVAFLFEPACGPQERPTTSTTRQAFFKIKTKGCAHLSNRVPAEVQAFEPDADALPQHQAQEHRAFLANRRALHAFHVFEAPQVDRKQAELTVPLFVGHLVPKEHSSCSVPQSVKADRQRIQSPQVHVTESRHRSLLKNPEKKNRIQMNIFHTN